MAQGRTSPDHSLVNAGPHAIGDDRRPQDILADPLPPLPLLSTVVLEAARRAFTKQGLAAAHLGKDESNFSRDVKAERLPMRDLATLGAPFLAELGHLLLDHYGVNHDPKECARRALMRIEDEIRLLRQFVEHL